LNPSLESDDSTLTHIQAAFRRVILLTSVKNAPLSQPFRLLGSSTPRLLESCDRNFLAGQGILDGDRKIAAQLSPVLMAIRPGSKLKGDRTGAEVDHVDLR